MVCRNYPPFPFSVSSKYVCGPATSYFPSFYIISYFPAIFVRYPGICIDPEPLDVMSWGFQKFLARGAPLSVSRSLCISTAWRVRGNCCNGLYVSRSLPLQQHKFAAITYNCTYIFCKCGSSDYPDASNQHTFSSYHFIPSAAGQAIAHMALCPILTNMRLFFPCCVCLVSIHPPSSILLCVPPRQVVWVTQDYPHPAPPLFHVKSFPPPYSVI